MKLLQLIRVLVLFVFSPLLVHAADRVLITEIMYHPASLSTNDEWIELHNAGSTTVNLQGWRISQGVDFIFTNAYSLTPGSYVVVCANFGAFALKYPAVVASGRVLGGWRGTLRNSGESVQIEDAAGNNIDTVEYADEGDWGVRVRGELLRNHRGWEWSAPHSGTDRTLELVNLTLSNDDGQNWAASSVFGGTPAAVNSAARTDTAPFILEATHFPLVPKSTDSVAISARIVPPNGGLPTVRLFQRVDANPQSSPFTSAPMFDDGAHNDGEPGDGVYGASIAARPSGTIVEFYLEAVSPTGKTNTWPAPVLPASDGGGPTGQVANALFQFDDAVYAGDQPVYRLIMREAERVELYTQINGVDRQSDAKMNCTFIATDGTGGEVRYLSGTRIRGAGSRGAEPPNQRVEIPSDRPWHGLTRFNLNSQVTHAQVAGAFLAARSGLDAEYGRVVQVRVNGANLANPGSPQYGSYIHLDAIDSTFIDTHYPLDNGGNAYRASTGNHSARLNYLGTNPADYIAAGYSKQNNNSENDWSDLIQLTEVLSNTSDEDYVAAVEQVANVEQWMRFFAVFALTSSGETSLGIGNGDDYALYRGSIDPRFRLVAHDFDTILGQGGSASITTSLWRATNVANIGRFMRTPEFTPVYYRVLNELLGSAFSEAQVSRTLEEALGSWVTPATVFAMKTFASNRVAYVRSQIPLTLTVSSTLPTSFGFPSATTPTVTLNGFSHAIETRSVLVNGSPVEWTPVGARWSGTATLNPGINRILVQSLNSNGVEFARATYDVWYDDGSVSTASGNLNASTTWTRDNGPYHVTADLTIAPGATLTIEPGTTVYIATGARVTVSGRLVAEGTDTARIRFTAEPGAGSWGSLDFVNTGAIESRIAFADFDASAGVSLDGRVAQLHVKNSRLFVDHCSWSGDSAAQYIVFDASSFVVQHSTFASYPIASSRPTLIFGNNGIPAGGHGILRDNYFGRTWGASDTINFNGGNRPGPILQVIGNVFDGAGDDQLELNSADAWIEGNTFVHVHRDLSRTDSAQDTASAISGGVVTAGQYSEWTIVNNLFYDLDHAVAVRQGNRFAFVNNTVAHVAQESGSGNPADIAVFSFNDQGAALPAASIGAGAYIANNVVTDASQLVANYSAANHAVLFTNNLLFTAWSGPGGGNVVGEARLNAGLIGSPTTASWQTIQAALIPRPGSLALGSGWGAKYDKGAFNTPGLMVFGEPQGTTAATTATLTVVPGGTQNWGSSPYSWGYTHYKWKLDNGPWSAELPISSNPTISLSGLSQGSHTVYVVGKNDAGYYQDNPFVYPPDSSVPAHVTASRTWTVSASFGTVRLSELLALNDGAVQIGGEAPDFIELYNPGNASYDLSGVGLTDDPTAPYKFAFPAGTTIGAGQYLTVFADSEKTPAGIHTGFGLGQDGDTVFIYNAPGRGGALLDSVRFGIQLSNHSIARRADLNWGLATPTFGTANQFVAVGEPKRVLINEWRTDQSYGEDFIELRNMDTLPVDLGGASLTDTPQTAPNLHVLPPLSFVAPSGYMVLTADGAPESGASHLNFKLSADRGEIALFSSSGEVIDWIQYSSQSTDISQGRSPDGALTYGLFPQPTPGAPNPVSQINVVVEVENIFNFNKSWRFNQTSDLTGVSWMATNYNDSSWSTGSGLLGVEDCGCLPYPIGRELTLGRITYYFRTTFTLSTNPASLSFDLRTVLDDGAVIYVNGVEVQRIRMGSGTPAYATQANQSVGNAGVESFTIPGSAFRAGLNVMAVEVHQQGNNSSDVVWGAALDSVRRTTNVTGVVITEVMASNQSYTSQDGSITDWVELYNPGASVVDLSDMSFSDDLATPRRWVFPAGVSLAPGAYLLVKFDPDTAPSTVAGPSLNAGFGFNASGDRVLLFDKASRGSALLDSVSFGLQAADFSISRVPAPRGPWVLSLPTEGAANIAAGLGSLASVRINEWMASPSSGEDWFEVFNPSAQPVDISGCYLTDNLTDRTQYRIPNLSFLGAGLNAWAEFTADNDPSLGADHTNFRLSAGGESLGLFATNGLTAIDTVTFAAQQEGVSQGRFPDASTNIIRFPESATPGGANFLPFRDLLINEALTHSDPPLEDAIELHNHTQTPVNIGGWYLSDSPSVPRKFRIPDNTIVQAGGFVVFFEHEFNPTPGIGNSFSLSSGSGDQIHLSVADAAGNLKGYRVTEDFGPQFNGVSFGKYETSVGYDFVAMSSRTFGVDAPATLEQFRTSKGRTNVAPVLGPVVITEIHYHPPDIGTNENTLDEFVELFNHTSTNVPLHDPAHPTNTWRLRNAVEFDFPAGSSMPARTYAVVVGFDPATNATTTASFRSRYGVPAGVPLYGPLSGKLANDMDNVELRRPDAPNADDVPTVLVERVRYADQAPWPAAADWSTNGARGVSLQRISPQAYANYPVNWVAGTPTAGVTNGAPLGVRPTLTLQPTNRTASAGTTVSMVASASGPLLRYQWRFNGADILNATNASYSITSIQYTNTGRYSVRVVNPYGAVVSTNALVLLSAAPEIVYQPQSRSAAVSQTVSFTVGARGAQPLNYQWRKENSNIPGANSPVLTLTNVQLTDAGNYSVVVGNGFGSVTSTVAVLNFNSAPIITAQPQSTNAFVGQSASFSVTAIGSTPMSFQWRFNGANLGGATASTLNLANVQTNRAGNYSVLISNAFGMATSLVATLTVVVPPTVTVAATDAFAGEAGSNPGQFTVSRTGPNNYPVNVAFTVSGTAQNGSDYQAISSPIVIPVGSSSVVISVIPNNDAAAEANETVVLTLAVSGDYMVGASGSATVTIADDDNLPSDVALTAPAHNAVYPVSPTNIQVSAVAQDFEGLVRVEFFSNGTNKIGQVSAPGPYTFTWVNAEPGSNAINAVAVDVFGATTVSAPVNIFVNGAPGVAITTPADGALVEFGTILMTATATDTNGSVTRVDFYVDNAFRGTVSTPPFTLSISNVVLGPHQAYAIAFDNYSLSATSEVVSFTAVSGNTNFANMFTNRGFVNWYTHRLSGQNATADKEAGEPRHWTNSSGVDVSGRSIWISWSAPAVGAVSIDTFFSTFDTLLAVYTNRPGMPVALTNLVLVGNSDDASNVQSRVQFTNNIVGQTYHIAVSGYNGATGAVTMRIELASPAVITSLRRSGNVFSGMLTGGTLNRGYFIEASTNLDTWATVRTVTNTTGQVSFSDTNNAPRRMYRARQVP